MRTAPLPATLSERDWQRIVVDLARYGGFRIYHTHDSRRSHAGFPDLVLVRPPRVIFAELKTSKGRVRPEQEAWLGDLSDCPGVETYLWRPEQLEQVRKVLAR